MKKTKTINVGGVLIGGGAPVSIQTMTCAPAEDYEKVLHQVEAVKAAGADIVRLAIPSHKAVRVLGAVRERVDIPIVADIHFDYRLALEACAAGVDKIRINPGNIGSDDRVKAVADACRLRGIPIRVGVNGGSLDRDLLAKYGRPCAEALCDSALAQAKLLESFDFTDICLSLKTTSVNETIKAYRLISSMCDYPLHIGVTEPGGLRMGLIKSAVGIGSLLCDLIGDTLRVSLSADPTEEVYAGRDILRSVGLRGGVNVISCPTCGRTKVDVLSVSEELTSHYSSYSPGNNYIINAAVMGCTVNGPGEAREADIGIAGGGENWLTFSKGKPLGMIPASEGLPYMYSEINKLIEQNASKA